MPILKRTELDQLKLKTQVVDVPEWTTASMVALGEIAQVIVRELTGAERDHYEAGLMVIKAQGKNVQRSLNLQNARARLVGLIMVDEEGNRLYKDNELHLLGKLPGAGLDRVFDAARSLSGITDDEQAQLEGNAEDFTQAVTNGSGSV